MLKNLIPFMS